MVAILVKNFVVIGVVVVVFKFLLSFTLESPIHGPKNSVLGIWLPKFRGTSFRSQKGTPLVE